MTPLRADQVVEPVFTVRTADGETELDAYSEEGLAVLANLWTRAGWQHKLSYETTWLGVPIIQLPEDILILQELIWRTRPTVVVECGVAHGGALMLYASMLELLGRGHVIGIDVEIRKYNRLAIESHPMSKRISLIEASSIEPATFALVASRLQPTDQVMVTLDSNHSRQHVLTEMEMYSPLVTPGGYLVVFDSVMALVHDSPNGKSEWLTDNPLAAVEDFLEVHKEFEQDHSAERMGVTYCTGGFLRRRLEA